MKLAKLFCNWILDLITDLYCFNYWIYEDLFDFNTTITKINEKYVELTYERRYDDLEKVLQSKVQDDFGVDSQIDIYFVESCPEKIDVVYFYFKNLVIEEFDTNKYRVEVVKDVSKRLDISDVQVVVRYGW